MKNIKKGPNIKKVSGIDTISTKLIKLSANFLTLLLKKNINTSILSAYRKKFSSQNLLISLIKERRKNLDNNFVVGAVLTDLSKAFSCIPHNLLIAKLSAYNSVDEDLSYIHLCLTNCSQCLRINYTYSKLETIILGVPQGSILGRLFSTYQ